MTLLLASIYFALVDHSTIDAEVRGAAPLPVEIAARFACDPGVPLEVALEDARDGSGRAVLRGTARFRRAESGEMRELTFDYYRALGLEGAPLAGRRPAVVVSPITGGGYEVSRMVAHDLAAHGYHAVIVKRSRKEQALRGQTDLHKFEAAMRDTISARMRVIDWLVTREEVDAARIGAYGVSLGAMLTAVLAAVDERVTASVVVMGCGDLPALLCRSEEREPQRLARANGVPANPRPADLAAFAKLARPILQTDPQLLAKHVDPREIFLVTTRRDKSVPSDLQERLYEALGSPEAISLPTGHYSAVAYLPVILESGRGFLARRFEAVGR